MHTMSLGLGRVNASHSLPLYSSYCSDARPNLLVSTDCVCVYENTVCMNCNVSVIIANAHTHSTL